MISNSKRLTNFQHIYEGFKIIVFFGKIILQKHPLKAFMYKIRMRVVWNGIDGRKPSLLLGCNFQLTGHGNKLSFFHLLFFLVDHLHVVLTILMFFLHLHYHYTAT